MRKSLFIAFCYFIALSFLTVKALGAEFLIKDLTRSDNKQNSWIALPYAFSSDSMGFTVGAVVYGMGSFNLKFQLLALCLSEKILRLTMEAMQFRKQTALKVQWSLLMATDPHLQIVYLFQGSLLILITRINDFTLMEVTTP